ncbi:MAG: DedA family protein [Candidatus Pacebacteria bacterium]|nr:DedA family protein [Candidatus Paceibacterota bacterium]
MDFILENIIPYLVLYKYLTIFIIAFIAAFIVPIPSGSILMTSSAMASIGYLNIYWVIIFSIMGNILGDNLGYFVARTYGVDFLKKIGFRRILNSSSFINIEKKFNKHPGFIIFISRFEVVSTLAINLFCGISKTNYKKYLFHESLGSVTQVIVYSLIGYLFADRWMAINSTMGKVTLIIAIIIIFTILTLNKRRIKHKLNSFF